MISVTVSNFSRRVVYYKGVTKVNDEEFSAEENDNQCWMLWRWWLGVCGDDGVTTYETNVKAKQESDYKEWVRRKLWQKTLII